VTEIRGQKSEVSKSRALRSGLLPAPNSLLVALTALLFAFSAFVEAQQSKLTKIGWFRARPVVVPGSASVQIRQQLRELGYIEGQNVVFEYRYTDGNQDRLGALAEELVRLKVDLLLASSTPEALAAQNATRTIPIVFYAGSDPVTAGLVESLARPGGNITGFTFISPLLASKRLELVKEIVPKISRISILWDPQDPGSALEWQESQLPARQIGLQLHSMEVTNGDKYASAFAEATKARSGAVAVTRGSLINRYQRRIADLAAKHRLPAIYARTDFVESGGLMSYGADPVEAYRRVASIVDKIIKGRKPAEIPIEQPTKFELVINLKAAKQIGLTIPQSVLYRADKVIR
jgi:putative tryptophan/tyrosine transport system substrate-binding protein